MRAAAAVNAVLLKWGKEVRRKGKEKGRKEKGRGRGESRGRGCDSPWERVHVGDGVRAARGRAGEPVARGEAGVEHAVEPLRLVDVAWKHVTVGGGRCGIVDASSQRSDAEARCTGRDVRFFAYGMSSGAALRKWLAVRVYGRAREELCRRGCVDAGKFSS